MVLCNDNCNPCCDYCVYVIYEVPDYYGQNDIGNRIGCIKHIEHDNNINCCDDFHCIDAEVKDGYNMSTFRLAVTCPVCDEVIIQNGWGIDSTLPDRVINLDSFACEQFDCHNCGTIVYTGDVDCMYEYEEGFVNEDD